MFDALIPGITLAATGLFGLVFALCLLSAGATGVQMFIDLTTDNVLAQRQHKGKIVKVLGMGFLFGSFATVSAIVHAVVAGAGG